MNTLELPIHHANGYQLSAISKKSRPNDRFQVYSPKGLVLRSTLTPEHKSWEDLPKAGIDLETLERRRHSFYVVLPHIDLLDEEDGFENPRLTGVIGSGQRSDLSSRHTLDRIEFTGLGLVMDVDPRNVDIENDADVLFDMSGSFEPGQSRYGSLGAVSIEL